MLKIVPDKWWNKIKIGFIIQVTGSPLKKGQVQQIDLVRVQVPDQVSLLIKVLKACQYDNAPHNTKDLCLGLFITFVLFSSYLGPYRKDQCFQEAVPKLLSRRFKAKERIKPNCILMWMLRKRLNIWASTSEHNYIVHPRINFQFRHDLFESLYFKSR